MALPILLAGCASEPVVPRSKSTGTFTCGVASGDPTQHGVVLWTRIDPASYRDSEPVGFQVAGDLDFQSPVSSGQIAPGFGPVTDYTLKVDLEGALDPGKTYYYRFLYRGEFSPTGRCRTLPVSPEVLNLAIVNCQRFSAGYYNAFYHLAQNSDIDFVLHLGDFIYDSGHQSTDFPERSYTLPSGRERAYELADYRFLYRKYRSDPNLQVALAAHTWIFTWDDHETLSNCYWNYQEDSFDSKANPYKGNREASNRIKLEAMQAWSEYVPARVEKNPGANHPFDYFRIYRSFIFGDLVDLIVTDLRSYRSGPACGEANEDATLGCPELNSPEVTMLGTEQKQWFLDQITHSRASWSCWASSVLHVPLGAGPLIGTLDIWDGYPKERAEIAQAVQESNLKNFLVLSGDLHAGLLGRVLSEYPDGEPIGLELLSPPLSSDNFSSDIPSWLPTVPLWQVVESANPHLDYFESQYSGYASLRLTRSEAYYTVYALDKSRDYPDQLAEIPLRARIVSGVKEFELR